jgi:hypothetical protein
MVHQLHGAVVRWDKCEFQGDSMPDKWTTESATPTVEFYHSALRKLVAERQAASSLSWEDAVVSPDLELTAADFEILEDDLLATGYLFEVSALVSSQEDPDKYKPVELVGDSGTQPTDDEGRPIVGTGDNVFQSAADVTGTARFISTLEIVIDMIDNGVPDETIAIIDDSGGTLTAPILQFFKGVVCMGGTVRSHLGILTREYGIPCLMAAELDGLKDGDQLLVETSRPATDAYQALDEEATDRPRVIRTS